MTGWSDAEARKICDAFPDVPDDIALRVYSSRLLGRDPSLVLHGGGNTSVKTVLHDDLGDEIEVLCVKGSGWDLGDIEPPGLPAVALEPLRRLRALESLTDEAMVRNTRRHLLDPGAPNPSVETLLHAFLPHKYIDHTHADAVLALADQPDAADRIRQVYGDQVGIVPYIMPGFQLAKLAAEVFEANPNVIGLILVNHGIFSFGDTAREAYERMMDLVAKAKGSVCVPTISADQQMKPRPLTSADAAFMAQLRGALTGHPEGIGSQVLHLRRSARISAFLRRADLGEITQRGPATPDHIIRTKQCPLILQLGKNAPALDTKAQIEEKIARYAETYHHYFREQAGVKGVNRTELHPLPMVFLVPGLGLVTAGMNHKAAKIAADIYEHTMDVIENAERIGRYNPLPQADLFDMEYWSLEQAKLGKKKKRAMEGRVAVISGAAGGIGAAVAGRLAEAGCHLMLTDLADGPLASICKDLSCRYGVTAIAYAGDLTHPDTARAVVDRACWQFGGVDYVVSNAGKAMTGPIGESTGALAESLEINLMAQQHLAAAGVRILREQGNGGCLLFTASKAAFNPGAGFGPYNIAKAGLVAMMKQYAVEYAAEGIRSLAVNPDRVRTALFDPKLLAHRAAARGLTSDAYFKANLLGREVLAEDVAETCFFLLSADKSTGTFFNVDGGNLAASPR